MLCVVVDVAGFELFLCVLAISVLVICKPCVNFVIFDEIVTVNFWLFVQVFGSYVNFGPCVRARFWFDRPPSASVLCRLYL